MHSCWGRIWRRVDKMVPNGACKMIWSKGAVLFIHCLISHIYLLVTCSPLSLTLTNNSLSVACVSLLLPIQEFSRKVLIKLKKRTSFMINKLKSCERYLGFLWTFKPQLRVTSSNVSCLSDPIKNHTTVWVHPRCSMWDIEALDLFPESS